MVVLNFVYNSIWFLHKKSLPKKYKYIFGNYNFYFFNIVIMEHSNLNIENSSLENKLETFYHEIARSINTFIRYATSARNQANSIKNDLDPFYASIISFDDILSKIASLEKIELHGTNGLITLIQVHATDLNNLLKDAQANLSSLWIQYDLYPISESNIDTTNLTTSVKEYQKAYETLQEKTKEIEAKENDIETKMKEKWDLERDKVKNENQIKEIKDEISQLTGELNDLIRDKYPLETELSQYQSSAHLAADMLVHTIENSSHKEIIREYEWMQYAIKDVLNPRE